MNDQLVSMITQLVMEKMEKNTGNQAPEVVAPPAEQSLIKIFDTVDNRPTEITESQTTSQGPLIKLYQHGASVGTDSSCYFRTTF